MVGSRPSNRQTMLGPGGVHLDVSAVVLLALMTQHERSSKITERALEYVLRQRSPEGLWNSFWWKSALYGTEVSLAAIQAAPAPIDPGKTRKALADIVPDGPFESALLVSSIIGMTPDSALMTAWPIIVRLIKEQQ